MMLHPRCSISRAPGLPRVSLRNCNLASPPALSLCHRPHVSPALHAALQLRSYASQQSPPNRLKEELERQARAELKSSQSSRDHALPERLLIYHAGTGRITFLAMLKLTSLLLGAFFGLVAVPSYVKDDRPPKDIAGVALCGLIPILFLALTTTPFVTHIHIHLPPHARTSRPILTRFIASLPPSTHLTLTTMSPVAKPRYSSLAASDLRPASTRQRRGRLGMVNYVRTEVDAAGENARRRWFMFRAVKRFYIQEDMERPAASVRPRYQGGKTRNSVVEGWIWEAISDKMRTRAGAASR